MAGNGKTGGVMVGIAAWLGEVLMEFAAREELRVRYVIAKAASQARTQQSKPRAE